MKILPDVIKPFSEILIKKHNPKSKDYTKFNPCLRWDFGFTCPFCLLHESDLTIMAHGSGVFWTEHFIPQSVDSSIKHDYNNCIYSCRYCNHSRGIGKNSNKDGHKLLNPTTEIWSNHFSIKNDQLTFETQDYHASYTNLLYDLNDDRKVKARKRRRESLQFIKKHLKESPSLIQNLNDLLNKDLKKDDKLTLIKAIQNINNTTKKAKKDLKLFIALPEDKPTICDCTDPPDLKLPNFINYQQITN